MITNAQLASKEFTMIFTEWILSSFLLLQGILVSGQLTIDSCNRTLSLHCNDRYPSMVVLDLNTTSSLAPKILQGCNAQISCQVSNYIHECVQIVYYCRPADFPTLILKKSSTVELASRSMWLRLMSKHYLNGEYQDAENVFCSLRFTEEGNHLVELFIREFAPFIHSRDFCLKLQNSTQPLICSGSHTFLTTNGPFNTNGNSFDFQMVLSNNSTVPNVRFWINIRDIRGSSGLKRLVCRSQPAKEWMYTKAHNGSVPVLMTIVIICGLLVVCSAVFICVLLRKRRSSNFTQTNAHEPEYEEIDEQPIYTDITENWQRPQDSDYLEPLSQQPEYLEVIPSLAADNEGYISMESTNPYAND